MYKLADRPVANWLQHRQFDLIAAYLRRGRRFAEIGSEHLNIRWLEAVVAWASHHAAAQLRDQACDLQSELLLRRIQPPWRLLAPALRDIERRARRSLDATSPVTRIRLAEQLFAGMDGLNADGSRASRH